MKRSCGHICLTCAENHRRIRLAAAALRERFPWLAEVCDDTAAMNLVWAVLEELKIEKL